MERTRDPEIIRSILGHPDIYPYISDDSCPVASGYYPILSESIIYLYEPKVGIIVLAHDNYASCVGHVNILPESRGKAGIRAGKAAIEWCWRNTRYSRIWSGISEDNVRAIRYAELIGMKRFGVNEKSFMRNGKLLDQIMLGVSR